MGLRTNGIFDLHQDEARAGGGLDLALPAIELDKYQSSTGQIRRSNPCSDFPARPWSRSMPTRDILFPMISYPTATANGAVEKAVGLAASLGAHISGLTFELDIRSPVGLYAHPSISAACLRPRGPKAPQTHATSLQPSTMSPLG
jgi:hypothetical protein